jgi:hypothetical protein
MQGLRLTAFRGKELNVEKLKFITIKLGLLYVRKTTIIASRR